MADDVKITRRKITDYQPDPHNANLGTPRGLGMIEDSLRAVGPGRSLVADAHDVLAAGNKTQEAAVNAGITEVVEIESDGQVLVVHKRRDYDLSDPQGQARQYAYLDNRAQELSLAWDAQQIATDIAAGVDVSAMFTPGELVDIGVQVDGEPTPDPGAQVDKAGELQQVWQVQRGDVWECGRHRLLCGDSTNAEDVARVMAGERAVLMVTDPPYGVEYDAHWREEYDQFEGRSVDPVVNDDRDDWTETYNLFSGDVAYVWHASQRCVPVGFSLMNAGFDLRYHLIWRKQHFVFSRGHYHWQHEPCWYAVRKGAQAHWIGSRDQSSVWDIANHNPMGGNRDNGKTTHSTEKPLECMARPIRNHEAAIVYDPFLGSGTTLVACEQLGRQGRGIDIEPKYCAVALDRLQKMGLTPIRATEYSAT